MFIPKFKLNQHDTVGSLSLTKVNKSLFIAIMHECVSDALNFSEASEPTFGGLLN